jgi:type IV secretion system protein TrbG
MELRSTEKTYMASVSWVYAEDQIIALRRQNAAAEAASPFDTGLDISRLRSRYTIEGDHPPWRPLHAFDDDRKVYGEFLRGIARGEMPPLFSWLSIGIGERSICCGILRARTGSARGQR